MRFFNSKENYVNIKFYEGNNGKYDCILFFGTARERISIGFDKVESVIAFLTAIQNEYDKFLEARKQRNIGSVGKK